HLLPQDDLVELGQALTAVLLGPGQPQQTAAVQGRPPGLPEVQGLPAAGDRADAGPVRRELLGEHAADVRSEGVRLRWIADVHAVSFPLIKVREDPGRRPGVGGVWKVE